MVFRGCGSLKRRLPLGFGTAAGCCVAGLRGFDLIFHAVAAAFQDDGFGVVEEPVQYRAGEGAVVVEDFRPVFIGLVGGQHYGALLVSLADDLEEQIRPGLVDGQVAQFVHRQERGFGVALELRLEPTCGLGCRLSLGC